MMSSTPRHRLLSGDVSQPEFVCDSFQMQHYDSSDIESNSINRSVSSYDDTHVDQINMLPTFCDFNQDDSACIASTSADTSYSIPSGYLETCVSCDRLLKQNCVIVFKEMDYNMQHEIVKQCIGNRSTNSGVKEFIC